MTSVSSDSHTGANSISLSKESGHTLFEFFSPYEHNDATDDAVSTTRQQSWY